MMLFFIINKTFPIQSDSEQKFHPSSINHNEGLTSKGKRKRRRQRVIHSRGGRFPRLRLWINSSSDSKSRSLCVVGNAVQISGDCPDRTMISRSSSNEVEYSHCVSFVQLRAFILDRVGLIRIRKDLQVGCVINSIDTL